MQRVGKGVVALGEVGELRGEALLRDPRLEALGEPRDGNELEKVALGRAEQGCVAVVRAEQLLGPLLGLG